MILAKHTVYHQTELIFITIVMWFSFTNSKNAKIQQIRLFTRLSQNKFRQKTQKTLKKQDQFDIFTRFFVSQLSIHCQITRQSPFGQKLNLELQIWKNDMFLARHTECRHPANQVWFKCRDLLEIMS